jgi:hypothetical protein
VKTRINKIYNITLPKENTIQENQEYTKEHQEILQSFTLLLQERVPNGTKNHKKKWERKRESRERFWHNRVVVKNSCQND